MLLRVVIVLVLGVLCHYEYNYLDMESSDNSFNWLSICTSQLFKTIIDSNNNNNTLENIHYIESADGSTIRNKIMNDRIGTPNREIMLYGMEFYSSNKVIIMP